MTTVSDLYARKSNSDAGRSAAKQKRLWLADCANEGFTPGREFVDPDLSASRYATKERPDYAALVEWIKGNHCEVVSMWEASRGSRQMDEWVPFLTLCRKYGVLIRIFGELDDPVTYDPRRQRDRDALMKEGMAAEGEIERLRARTLQGRADAALEGRPSGTLQDGYRRIYGPLTDASQSLTGRSRREIQQVIDPERAHIYRDAAEAILSGVPANTVARRLNKAGVVTPSGEGKWRGGALIAALLRPGMQGHRVHKGQVVAYDAWEPIIDQATALRLRALRDSPTVTRATRDTRLTHMLSGAVLCGLCRHGMQGKDHRTLGRRYYCDHNRGGCGRLSTLMDRVDGLVSEMVTARLRRGDAADVFAADIDNTPAIEAQAELDELERRRKELVESAARPGGPSMALVAAAERQLQEQIDTVRERLRQFRTPKVLRSYDPAHLADRWTDYPVGERRAVILALAEVVVAPIGAGTVWRPERLGQSRWHGDTKTWADYWKAA